MFSLRSTSCRSPSSIIFPIRKLGFFLPSPWWSPCLSIPPPTRNKPSKCPLLMTWNTIKLLISVPVLTFASRNAAFYTTLKVITSGCKQDGFTQLQRRNITHAIQVHRDTYGWTPPTHTCVHTHTQRHTHESPEWLRWLRDSLLSHFC